MNGRKHELRLAVVILVFEFEQLWPRFWLLAGIGGTRDEVALHFVDGQGRPSTATSEGVIGADGVDLPDGLGELTRDHDRLRRLVVVTAPDLDLPAGRPDPGLLAQLAAARASLATLEEREQPVPVEPMGARSTSTASARCRGRRGSSSPPPCGRAPR